MITRFQKYAFSRVLSYSKLTHIALAFQKKSLICLSYHRISSDDFHITRNSFGFDETVFGPSASQFYEQMKWGKKHMYLVSEAELLDSIERRRPLPPKSLMITFDDGYVDNFNVAYPILKSLGVPGIFFVPTRFVNDRKLGWWDIITYLIKRTQKRTICFRSTDYEIHSDTRMRGAVVHRILELMKDIQMHRKSFGIEEFISELSCCCEVDLPSQEIQDQELMSWESIQKISSEGLVSIGSHGHTHRILSSLDLHEQRFELEKSKEILEGRLKTPIRSIAFPVGGYEHFHAETPNLAKEVGYSLNFSFMTGMNKLDQLDSSNIKRISVPRKLSHFSALMAAPHWVDYYKCKLDSPQPYQVR